MSGTKRSLFKIEKYMQSYTCVCVCVFMQPCERITDRWEGLREAPDPVFPAHPLSSRLKRSASFSSRNAPHVAKVKRHATSARRDSRRASFSRAEHLRCRLSVRPLLALQLEVSFIRCRHRRRHPPRPRPSPARRGLAGRHRSPKSRLCSGEGQW